MILRKPYAFLIKYFMLIHIALSALMIFVCIKFRDAASFINEYINNTAPISTADSYFTFPVYLAILAVIAISVTIFLLMRNKKKPKLLYLLNIALFAILLILAIVLGVTFSGLENQVLQAKTTRLLRDIIGIINIVQYVFILAMIIRTLGFDVKKFDFASDIRELEVTSEDNEEVEITLGVDSDKILRGIRHYFRELGYYYKENKTIILIILGIVVLAIAISIILNVNFINKVYNENETVLSEHYAMKVTESYLSNLNTSGENVSQKDKTYLIIQMNVQAIRNENKKIETEYLMLEVNNKRYDPVKKYYQYYSDIATGYTSQTLTYGDYKTYILMFEIDNEDINKKMLLTNVTTDRSIRIRPINIDKTTQVKEVNLKEKLDYKDTFIGDGSITINDYEMANRFDNIIAGYNKTVLKLGVNTDIKRYSNYSFLNTFVTLKTIKDNKTTTLEFENRTSKTNNDTIYLEVNKKIEEADKIYLEIRIRNKIYKYNIK